MGNALLVWSSHYYLTSVTWRDRSVETYRYVNDTEKVKGLLQRNLSLAELIIYE